ncbi:MAG: carbohydrate ABC transporter permease [Treponema sp.]|jgi:putative aldouronate transport system permease protein|nr:carbohydrate ABC transporter permease [Treponema sp.]
MKNADAGITRLTRIGPLTNAVFNLLLVILALVCLVPLLLVIAISFSDQMTVQESGYRLIPRVVSFEGYTFLYEQRAMILRTLGMSLFVTSVGTIFGIILTTSMGYILSRLEYKLQKFFTWLVFVPMVFNGGLVSTYFVISQFLGLRNSSWALILPLCVSSFNVIVCKTFFRSTIPDSVVESAKIDGASQFTIYFRIVLPLSLPVIATIGLFLSFAYWNDWFQAMLYIDDMKLYTLQAFLNRLLTDINVMAQQALILGASQAEMIMRMPREAARMAIVVIVVLPIACAYPFFQRYFISGLTIGAVKG